MTMIFERVMTPGIAQISYFIGDDSSGTAAVVDPRPNVDVYLRMAREHGVAITHAFETHIHADFMSGARELVDRVGSARIYASGEGGATYDFDVERISDGDTFEFGSVAVTAKFTPGHTPEHVSYALAAKDRADSPWGVLTGDSLFVGSAGRPDLLGEEQAQELVVQLYRTLRDYYLKLDDHVMIFPCHGAGSACGADIGDRPVSSIGYERRHNPFLQHEDLEGFKRFVDEGAPPEPAHYKRLKKLNAQGPPILGHAPTVPGMPPEPFKAAVERGDATLVDTRQMLAFGGGHIAGAINIGSRPELSVWAGDMLDADKPLLLVVEDEDDLDDQLWKFVYTGFTRFAGYLAGGMTAWGNAGYPLRQALQMTVHDLRDAGDGVQILDVRSPGEWSQGHIPGAKHQYVGDMRSLGDGVAGLEKDRPVAVYCGSGYRASIATSLLQAHGYRDVRNVPGSWQGWVEAGYPQEK